MSIPPPSLGAPPSLSTPPSLKTPTIGSPPPRMKAPSSVSPPVIPSARRVTLEDQGRQTSMPVLGQKPAVKFQNVSQDDNVAAKRSSSWTRVRSNTPTTHKQDFLGRGRSLSSGKKKNGLTPKTATPTTSLSTTTPMTSLSTTTTSSGNSSVATSSCEKEASSSTTTTSSSSNASTSSSEKEASSSTMTPEKEAARERQRKQVLREIIDTELQYCNDLDTLAEVFMLPLTFRGKEIGVSKGDVDVMFSNLELLINLNKQVLEQFEEQQEKAKRENLDIMQGVGEVFKSMAPFMKMYTQYSANQPKALRRLEYLLKNNEKFKKCVDIATADPRCRGLQFGGYLIKPVQRVCKYPLLLRELLKHTPPEHPDYATIVQAKENIDATVTRINEGKRTVEMQAKTVEFSRQFESLPIELVTPTRRYVHDGPSMLRHSIKQGAPQARHLFLFNDLVIVARQTSAKPSYQIKTLMPFEQARFIVISEQESVSNAFELLFKKKRFIFCFETKAIQQTWVNHFKKLTKEMKLAQLQKAKAAQNSQRK